MKDACARARAALNLMLLLCLLQAWLLFTVADPYISVVSNVNAIGEMYRRHPPDNESGSIGAFEASYIAAYMLSPQSGVRSMKLASVLAISDEEVRDRKEKELSEQEIEKIFLDEKNRNTLALSNRGSPVSFEEWQQRWQRDVRIPETIVGRLHHLRDLTDRSGVVVDTATIHDLEVTIPHELEVPFIKQKVDSQDAFWIIGVAMIAPLLVVFVVLDSICIKLRSDPIGVMKEPESMDLFILYRSYWGLVLGALWIFAPSILVLPALQILFFTATASSGAAIWDFTLGTVLLLLAVVTLRRACSIRRSSFGE
jgi:hypothetical protein